MSALLNIPTKTKILLLGLLVAIILTTVILALQTPPSQPEPTAEQISSQNTIIGKTITEEAEKSLNIISKEATDGGKIIYSLDSANPIRTDQIITQNNQIIFNRFYVPEDPNDPGHLLITQMTERYGEAEKVIQGSKLWGPFIQTYLYPSRGLAFIGNPNTNEVYEVQNFTPISIDEYLRLYGDDIDQTPPVGES